MAAEEILRFALFKEVLRAERRKRRKLNNGLTQDGEGSDEDGEGEEEEGEEEPVTEGERQRAREKARRLEKEDRPAPAPRARRDTTAPAPTPAAAAEEMAEDDDMDGADAVLDDTDITSERYVFFFSFFFPFPNYPFLECPFGQQLIIRLDLFRTRLDAVFTSNLASEGMIDLKELLPMINEGMDTVDLFGSSEARVAAERMNEGNEIMLAEGIVYKV
jgi:DNA replication licensing factor MCM3